MSYQGAFFREEILLGGTLRLTKKEGKGLICRMRKKTGEGTASFYWSVNKGKSAGRKKRRVRAGAGVKGGKDTNATKALGL